MSLHLTQAAPKSLPQHGQVVVFKQAPAGSYCSTGIRYQVERPGNRGDFRFVNLERGSSTYDRAWAVARAVWSEAA